MYRLHIFIIPLLLLIPASVWAQSLAIPPERLEPFFVELFDWESGALNSQNIVALNATYNSINMTYIRGNQNLLVEIEDILSQAAKIELFQQEYDFYRVMEPEDRPVQLRTIEEQYAILQSDENRGLLRLWFIVEDRFLVQFMMTGNLTDDTRQEFLLITDEFPVGYLVFLANYTPERD